MILSLAGRNLWRNRRRTLIALAALVIGTLMVVLLDGFRNGVVDLMTEGMVKAQVGAFQIHRAGFLEAIEMSPLKLDIRDGPELRSRILAVPGVADLTPRITFSGLATANGVSTVVVVMAVDGPSEARVFPLARRFVAGRSLRDSTLPDAAVLGGPLMRNLELSQGDTFALSAQTPEGQTNAVDLQLEGWLPVTDPFSGKRLHGRPAGLRPAAPADARAHHRVRRAGEDLRRIDEVAAAVRRELGPSFEVHTWLELQPLFRDLIRRQVFVLSAVSLVLFAIVLTGIVNVMAMSVYERVREIGTVLALGMRRHQILRLFLLEGALLGLWGGAAGAGLGWAIVAAAGASGVPFKAPGSAGTMPMHPSVSAALRRPRRPRRGRRRPRRRAVPAWRASRMRPVDALRAL